MGQKSREKKERRDGDYISEKKIAEYGNKPILWWVIFFGASLILFTPFIISTKYFFPFVGPKSLYFMGLVEIIFAAWLILIISNRKYRPRLNILTVAIGLFIMVAILSSVLGVDFSRSFWSKYERMTGLLMQFHLFAFFLVCSSTFKKKEDWLKLLGISVFAAILMSFVSLYPKALGSISSLSRGGATLGNSSFLGTYLLFNFFFAIYLISQLKGKIIKIIFVASAILIFIALYFSTARAALLATLGGAWLILLIWLIVNKRKQLKIAGISLAVASIIAVVVLGYLAFQPDNFMHTIYEKNIGATFGGRTVVWEGAWQGFLEKPIFGWGLENFEIVFTRNYNPCMGGPVCGGDIWYDRAHNIVFDTLVTVGAIGMLAYLGIFIAVFYVLWKKFLKGNISFWAASIFSIILITYFIQNLTVFDMINSYVMFFLVLAFVGVIATGEDESLGKKININMPLVVIALILSVVSFFVFVLKPLQADGEIINALSFPLGSSQRLALYEKTLQTSPVGKYQIRDFFTQSTTELIQSVTDASNISLQGVKNEMEFNIAEMEKTLKESPLDYRAYLKLGQLYNTYTVVTGNSKLIQAEEVLQGAIKLSPTNQQGYWALAQTKLYLGKGKEALSLAEEAQRLYPLSKQSNMISIQVAMIIGDTDLAQSKAKEALEIDPSWEEDIKTILGG